MCYSMLHLMLGLKHASHILSNQRFIVRLLQNDEQSMSNTDAE